MTTVPEHVTEDAATSTVPGVSSRAVLAGQVALISGAARRQGRPHAVELAKAGADIVAFDLCAQIATVEAPMAAADGLAETVRLVEAASRHSPMRSTLASAVA